MHSTELQVFRRIAVHDDYTGDGHDATRTVARGLRYDCEYNILETLLHLHYPFHGPSQSTPFHTTLVPQCVLPTLSHVPSLASPGTEVECESTLYVCTRQTRPGEPWNAGIGNSIFSSVLALAGAPTLLVNGWISTLVPYTTWWPYLALCRVLLCLRRKLTTRNTQ